jgi:hypothetical protein
MEPQVKKQPFKAIYARVFNLQFLNQMTLTEPQVHVLILEFQCDEIP